VEENFLTQLVSEPTREGASLDLLFTDREGLVGDVVVGGCRGLRDHKMTEFLVCGEVKRGASKTTSMDFQRADFGLSRMLVERVPWERVLKGKGVQAGRTFFKEVVSKAQEQAVPVCHKTNWWGRCLAWLNRELLLGLRKQRRVYHLWKKGQVTQEEYRGLVRSCREEIRKTKSQLELRLATVVRDNKKCFYKYTNNKKAANESLHPLLDARGNIASKDEEKAEVHHAFFVSVFNSQTGCSQDSQPPVLEDREGVWKKPLVIQEEAVNDLLCLQVSGAGWNPPKSAEGTAEELAKPLSTIYQQSWLTGEVPDDCRIASVTPVYKKGQKEDPGNYRPVSAREDYGMIHPECAHQACEGQPGDQAQPAWVHERQVLLDQPDLLL